MDEVVETTEEDTFVALNCVKSLNNINGFILGSARSDDIMTVNKRGKVTGICQDKEIIIDALIVNGMSHNLISESRLLDKGSNVKFKKNNFDENKKMYAKVATFLCDYLNDLFLLNVNIKKAINNEALLSNNKVAKNVSSEREREIKNTRLNFTK